MKKREFEKSKYDEYVKGQNHVSSLKRNEHSLRFDYSSIVNNIPQGVNVLDVGCRSGQFVKKMQNLGFNAFGVDIGKGAEQNCINRHGKEWTQKYFKISDVQKNIPYDMKFHFINVSHTLEHFYDTDAAMKNIMDKLVDKGYVFIVVPSDLLDAGNDMKRLDKGSNYHWVFWESEEDVKNYLNKFGLNILSTKHNYNYNGKRGKVGEWQFVCRKN